MVSAMAMSMFLLAAFVPTPMRLLQPDDLPARRTAADVLAFGLQTWRELAPVEGEERLHGALATARRCLPSGSNARRRADELADSCRALEPLARGIAELVDDLRFAPVVESELPDGVPGFRVLDEIELRNYPACRLVRAPMRAGSIATFWQLFQHIQERQIAMTTPVQMEWRAEGDAPRPASMAFLYGSTSLGEPGKARETEVIDQPPVTVLTIGSRGYDRPERVAELRAMLERWLADHPEWRVAGGLRTMIYNSPSIGSERRCFEVQLPVQPVAGAGRRARAGS